LHADSSDDHTMQSSAEGLVTFLPHTLPFLCQPAGSLTGTVVIQSSVPAAAAPVQLVQQQRSALYACSSYHCYSPSIHAELYCCKSPYNHKCKRQPVLIAYLCKVYCEDDMQIHLHCLVIEEDRIVDSHRICQMALPL